MQASGLSACKSADVVKNARYHCVILWHRFQRSHLSSAQHFLVPVVHGTVSVKHRIRVCVRVYEREPHGEGDMS